MKIRYSILMGLAAMLPLCAQQQQDTHTTDRRKAPPAKTTAAPVKQISNAAPKQNPAQALQKPVTIPTDAVRIDSTHFRAKDEQGVEWNYVKTPFGIVKSKTDDESKPQSGLSSNEKLIATDQGDTVKFERRTPFGNNTWTKKKTELDDIEKQALAAKSNQASSTNPK